MSDLHGGSYFAGLLSQDGRWRMSVTRWFCISSQLVTYLVEGVIVLEFVCWHGRIATVLSEHSRTEGGIV